MEKRNALRLIGECCKSHREKYGIKQSQVAESVGYSEQNISSFETGRTNNLLIFLYYINKGLLDDLENRHMLKYIMENIKK